MNPKSHDDEPKSCGCGQDPMHNIWYIQRTRAQSNCNRRRWRTRWRLAMQFPKTNVHTDASMTTDKEVLTNIIRDRLKDYLMNGSNNKKSQ